MPASYPSSIPSFTTKIDNTDVNFAADINRVQDEIRAISEELGVLPKGSFGTVRERMEGLLTGKSDADHNHDQRYWRRTLVTSKGQVLVGTSDGNVEAVASPPDNRVFLSDTSAPTGTTWGSLTHALFSDLSGDHYSQYALANGTRGAFLPTAGGTVTGMVTFAGGIGEDIESLGNISGPVEFDAVESSVYQATLTGDVTVSLTGAQTGVARAITIALRQDGVGGHALDWPGSLVWLGSGPPAPGGGGTYALVSVTSFDGGNTWLGVALDQF